MRKTFCDSCGNGMDKTNTSNASDNYHAIEDGTIKHNGKTYTAVVKVFVKTQHTELDMCKYCMREIAAALIPDRNPVCLDA